MFGTIATVVISLAITYIAWQQWQIARAKLRLDLFDRRYKVYDATRRFLGTIVGDATFTDAQLWAFALGTSDAEFLFEPDVVAYLAQIRNRAIDMRTHQQVFAPLPVGEERSRHVQAQHDELIWLTHQLTEMTKVFSPYLSFSRVR
jgi:hypothetical protein